MGKKQRIRELEERVADLEWRLHQLQMAMEVLQPYRPWVLQQPPQPKYPPQDDPATLRIICGGSSTDEVVWTGPIESGWMWTSGRGVVRDGE